MLHYCNNPSRSMNELLLQTSDCPSSKYGVDCSETCGWRCADCDAVDGCVECDPGYDGSDCTRGM